MIGRIVAVALVAASLANGAGVYLKKIGLKDPDQYAAYWSLHCQKRAVINDTFGFQRCDAAVAPDGGAAVSEETRRRTERAQIAYLYRADGMERWLKALKELLMLGMIAWGLRTLDGLARLARNAPGTWPLALLLGVAACGSVESYLSGGWWPVIVGWRSLEFLLVAFFCGSVASARNMATWAAGVAVLMALQLPLLLPEWLYGVYVHGDYAMAAGPWKRLVGSFVHPNSLGVFMAAGLGFYYAFSGTRRYLLPLFCASLLVVVASGSGTGLVGLAVFVVAAGSRRVTLRYRPLLLLACGILAIGLALTLPSLLHRPDVFDSLWARLNSVRAIWGGGFSMAEMALGSGIGQGTNAALLLQPGSRLGGGGDSMLYSLVVQVGVVGAGLFFVALLGGLRCPGRHWPLIWMLALASLTATLHELFPVNLLLGLTLAHLLGHRQPTVAPVRRVSASS